jgi:hypothetical protein
VGRSKIHSSPATTALASTILDISAYITGLPFHLKDNTSPETCSSFSIMGRRKRRLQIEPARL